MGRGSAVVSWAGCGSAVASAAGLGSECASVAGSVSYASTVIFPASSFCVLASPHSTPTRRTPPCAFSCQSACRSRDSGVAAGVELARSSTVAAGGAEQVDSTAGRLVGSVVVEPVLVVGACRAAVALKGPDGVPFVLCRGRKKLGGGSIGRDGAEGALPRSSPFL